MDPLTQSQSWTYYSGKLLVVLGLVGIVAIDFVTRGQLKIGLALASLAVLVIGLKVATRW